MTELNLPGPMSEARSALPDLVRLGIKKAPYFSVQLSARQGLSIVVDNREERITEREPSAGSVLSAFDGATTSERAVGDFDRDALRRATQDFLDETTFQSYPLPAQPERRGEFATQVEIDPLQLSTQEKLDRCRELHRRAKGQDPRIVNVRVLYNETTEYSVFADSSADLAQRVQRVAMFLFVVVADETGQVRYDFQSKSGTAGWEVLTWSEEEIQKVLDGALALLSAERIEPGDYRIITAPGVSGTLCHESFGHGVETDMFLKERARAAHFIDKIVGSPLVNIFDDPGQPGRYGSYFFDDEGCLASSTQIVENGVFRRGITDRFSAAALEIPRSANGRRQDYSRKVYARMSNTFFGPGASTLEEMIAEVDHGIYLDK